jgi:hypothetical protein
MSKRLKNASPEPRHSVVKGLLDAYWQRENPAIPSLPWGPADAGALGQFLRANPALSTEIIAECLDNRLRSEDHAPAERVHRWIGDVLRYAAGPLNQFKQPMRDSSLSVHASIGTYQPGKTWSEPIPEETIRQFMGEEWFERACKRLASDPSKLNEAERRCLRDEGLLA